jgi:hypothetical protein
MSHYRVLLLGLLLLPSWGQAQQMRTFVVPGDAPVVIAPRGAAQPRLSGPQTSDLSFATRSAPGAQMSESASAGSLAGAGSVALPAVGAALLGAMFGGTDSVSSTTRTR